MSEEMLVCHCSPTLAGLKTGSLFSCPYSSQKMIIKEIREFNQKLTQKGIRIIPVRISDKRMLVYVYRPEKLKEDFRVKTNVRFKHSTQTIHYCAHGVPRMKCPVRIKIKKLANGVSTTYQNSAKHVNHRKEALGLSEFS